MVVVVVVVVGQTEVCRAGWRLAVGGLLPKVP